MTVKQIMTSQEIMLFKPTGVEGFSLKGVAGLLGITVLLSYCNFQEDVYTCILCPVWVTFAVKAKN